MKFAKSLLQRNLVPEWSQWYIDYKGLKKLVNQAVEERNKLGPKEAQNIAIDDSITAPFFYAIDRNLEIVDNFYNTKFAEYTRRLRHVERQCSLLWPQISQLEDADAEKEELIGVLLELRAHLRNLRWYAEVNKRGFTKILKKFDKKIGTQAKTQYLTSKILILGFSNGHEITDTIDHISKMYEELAPHLVDERAPIPHHHVPSSSRYQTPVPEHVDLLRQSIEADDATNTSKLLSQNNLSSKQLINLLLRALNSNAVNVIPILTERCAPFLADTEDDINRRNVLHRAVIAEGRRQADLATSLNKTKIEIGTGVPSSAALGVQTSNSASDLQRPLDSDANARRNIDLLLETVSNSHALPPTALLLAVDQQLRTPLHYAARYGLRAVAESLLSREAAPLTFSDIDNLRPLDLVVLHKHPFTLRTILHFQPPQKPQLLLMAARINAPKVCEMLIEHGGYDVNYRDPETGETALHVASKQDYVDVVRVLIKYGADIEIRENTFDWTPLFLAAVDGSRAIASELLAAGAKADITDASGWTPKEHAALRGHLPLAKLLPAPPESPDSLSSNGSGNGNPLEMRRTADTSVLKTFGHRYLDDSEESLVLVTLGSRDLREKYTPPIKLNTVPVSEAGKTQLDTALSLVVGASHTASDSFSVDLPVPELGLATEPIPFYTKNVEEMELMFDLVPTYSANSQMLARGVAKIPKQRRIQDLNAITQTAAIVEASTLRVLGTVTFEVLVVKPFVHPNNRVGFSSTYWRSLITTRVIGHRGLGKNTQSQSSLQLGENTVESFIQAANLGASYVEFDVQLTKDNIPVIYHDFLVGDSGFDIPMHSMTFDQFMNIQRLQRPVGGRKDRKEDRTSGTHTPEPFYSDSSSHAGDSTESIALPAADNANAGQYALNDGSIYSPNPKLQRSRSLHNLNRGDDEDGSYKAAMSRMQFTRDFKTKGFKGNVRGMHIQSKFATLEELFRTLPQGLGFNIECKYPMLDEAEAEEMDCTLPEVNHWVDTVLKVIYDHKGDRDIILSSFNPDVCILLSLKQPSLPVLFLTEGGTAEMMDIRASSLQEGIRFAKRFNLLGIVSAAEPLIMCPRLVRAVKESGLVCFTYGTDNNVPEYARRQLRAGVDAVIVDSVLAIRRELTEAASSDDVLMQEVSNAIEKAELNKSDYTN